MTRFIFLFSLANAVASGVTLLFFGYRYMWFSVETVPEDRVGSALMIFFMSLMITTIFYGLQKK